MASKMEACSTQRFVWTSFLRGFNNLIECPHLNTVFITIPNKAGKHETDCDINNGTMP